MKKVLDLTLALVLALSLCACGVSKAPPSEGPDGQQPTNNQPSPTENQPSAPEKTDAPEAETITFEEVAVVDNDECQLKITGIDQDNMWGYTLNAYLENKSSDKTYMFSVDSASVNGVQCSVFFATEVAAGKKANEDINFMDSTLEENGITDFSDIEISFRVYDSNDWTAEDVADVTAHVYPYGEDKATTFMREPQSSDIVIADNDYATAIVTGYKQDDIWGYTVNLFLINKSDTEIMFSVDEASVNGFMADPLFATTVAAGKCAFSSMSWSDTTFEENGISSVDEIEFLFRAYDSNNWTGDDFVNEAVTLNP